MVHCYYTDETINQFSIGYMINPSLNCNRVFIVQVENFLSVSFASSKMETIRDFLKNKNTCVIDTIMTYDKNGGNVKTVYRVLSCVVYYLIDNYVCNNYLLCQSKTLISISFKPTFGETSFNIIFGIGIPELLLNLAYCCGFMKKPNSTVILNCRSCMIKNYLVKQNQIIEKDSKYLSLLPNDFKLIINIIDQMYTDFSLQKK